MSFSTQRFKSGWFWSWFIRRKELTSANWLSSRDFCFSISVSWSRTKSSRRHMAQARPQPPYLPQMPKSEEKLFFIRLMVWYRYHPSWLMVSKCARQNQQNAPSLTQIYGKQRGTASQHKGSSPSCASLTCASNRASVSNVTYCPSFGDLPTCPHPHQIAACSHGSDWILSKSMQLVGCSCLLQGLFGFTAFGRILSVALLWLELSVAVGVRQLHHQIIATYFQQNTWVIYVLLQSYAPCHAMPFSNIWNSGDILTRNSGVSLSAAWQRCWQGAFFQWSNSSFRALFSILPLGVLGKVCIVSDHSIHERYLVASLYTRGWKVENCSKFLL